MIKNMLVLETRVKLIPVGTVFGSISWLVFLSRTCRLNNLDQGVRDGQNFSV